MNILELLKNIWQNYRYHIIYILIIIVLCMICCTSINSCTDYKNRNTQNIRALSDSISYYQGKNNELVASKTLLEGSIKDLKIANEELYNNLQSMKVSKPDVAAGVSTTITNELHDTIWVVEHNNDSIVREFDFSNDYRELAGTVTKKDSIMSLQFSKDIVNFDYTIAFKDDKVYVSSTNPYVKYNSITGYTIPKEKTKRWSFGPSVTGGYDPINNKFTGMIGFSITYGLLRW